MVGLYVPATAIANEPPRHNLLDSAEELEAPSTWAHGVQLRGESCAAISSWAPDCAFWPDGEKPEFAEPGILGYAEYPTFMVYAEISCQLAPKEANDEVIEITKRILRNGRTKAIEAELWTGSQNVTGFPNVLQDDPVIIGGGDALGYNFGLSVAGQALANCGIGTRGFIHAPPLVVSEWIAAGYLEEDERGRLVTIVRGDVVVAGSGYPGTGPEGEAISGNEAWIYATGPVAVKIGGDDEIEIIAENNMSADHRTNTLTVRAQQEALVAFDPCCHYAILVSC